MLSTASKDVFTRSFQTKLEIRLEWTLSPSDAVPVLILFPLLRHNETWKSLPFPPKWALNSRFFTIRVWKAVTSLLGDFCATGSFASGFMRFRLFWIVSGTQEGTQKMEEETRFLQWGWENRPQWSVSKIDLFGYSVRGTQGCEFPLFFDSCVRPTQFPFLQKQTTPLLAP